MVREVGAFEAKTHLAALLRQVQKGDKIVITHRGVPVAVMVSPEAADYRPTGEVIRKLAELRERTTRRAGSLRSLRVTGRRR
jgi:prevent-host-death family protein